MKQTYKEYFCNRASVRNFTEQIPESSLIENIVETAMQAPNTGNMQLYSVVETRDPDNLKKIAPFHFNQPAVVNAPVILTVCADLKRFERWCDVSDAQSGMRNLQMQLAAIIDATIFAQQIVTVAELEGLGTCYLGTITYNAPEIAEALDLPDGVLPVAALAMGYPAGKPEKCERLPLKAILHKEKYVNFDDSNIKELYKEKEEYAPNKKFVEENGKQTLAQVFTDVRYPKKNNELFSEKLEAYFLDKGLTLSGKTSE